MNIKHGTHMVFAKLGVLSLPFAGQRTKRRLTDHGRSYLSHVARGFCLILLAQAGILSLHAQSNPASSAPTSTSSQAPIAEIDAIAYDNLRNNAQQIYDAIKSKGGSFVIYNSPLFSQLPAYRPAVAEVDQLRQQLCTTLNLQPEVISAQAATATGIGTLFSGIAALLTVFKPSLTITGVELPANDQILAADFAHVVTAGSGKVYVPGVFLPVLEPDDTFASNACPSDGVGYPNDAGSKASITEEWRAASSLENKVTANLKGVDPNSPAGKKLQAASDAYTSLLKKYTTTDQSGNSPLASLVSVGRLETLLQQAQPLIVVLGVDDLGGSGWVKDKAFTVPVTYSGGSSAHYLVFDSKKDSSIIASGSVTSLNSQMESKSIGPQNLSTDLQKSRIALSSK